MSCGKPEGAHCPALHRVLGREAAAAASSQLLALYNARRDAGGQQLPTLQLALAYGATSVGSPNGSSVGIAQDRMLRRALGCSFRCWAHVSYQPREHVHQLIDSTLLGSGGSRGAFAPPVCVHARTMWVDDQRCFPNPKGCQLVDQQQLAYYNTSGAITHSCCDRFDAWRAITTKLAGEQRTAKLDSLTLGVASPLWWQLQMHRPRRVCRLVIRPGRLSAEDRPKMFKKRRRRVRKSSLAGRLSRLDFSCSSCWGTFEFDAVEESERCAHGCDAEGSMALHACHPQPSGR